MQGLIVPIAILSLVAMFVVAVGKTLFEMKEGGVMENKVKILVNMNLNILYTMSANLAGGALLAKTFQLQRWHLCKYI